MKRFDLSAPEFGFIIATRAALGAGVGLLLADRLRRRRRRAIGSTLVALGVLTTIPAAITLFGCRHSEVKEKIATA
jgi:hypothetical protein